MKNQNLYHLYPDITQKNKEEYYAVVSISDDGTATLFLWGEDICTIRLSDNKVIFIADNLKSKEKKMISDFKKHLAQNESYIDVMHYLYFNGEEVDDSFNGPELFDELYQMLEDAEDNNEFVDIPNCYLSRVPVIIYKDGSPDEYLWDKECIFFRITDPNATISEVLDIMDRTPHYKNN